MLPLRVHPVAEDLRGHGPHEDLDARLVLVVAASVAVVDAHDGFEVRQQVALRESGPDDAADRWRAAEAAADEEVEHDVVAAAVHPDADVVHVDGGPVRFRAVEGDLELARQPVELRVLRGPLADDLAVGAGVHPLVRGDAGELVRRDVADAASAGLDAVHAHLGEVREDVRHDLQGRPVDLHVLPGGQVAVALVVAAGDVGEGAELFRGQRPVGHRDAEHRREPLDVEAVAQPQLQELVVRQFPREVPLRLLAVLRDALVQEALVEFVVEVHLSPRSSAQVFPPGCQPGPQPPRAGDRAL